MPDTTQTLISGQTAFPQEEAFGVATYNLALIKTLLQSPATRIITGEANRNASSLGYLSIDEIIQRALLVETTDIYKTMPSKNNPGTMQDVYRSATRRDSLYIKFQLTTDHKAVLIQFKTR